MGPQREGPMRRAVLVMVGLMSAAPALAQQPPQQFECFEEARACTDPNDVPSSCTVDIPDLQRQTPQQVILRDLQVAEGPFTGTMRYEIQRGPGGSHVTIQNVGQPTGLNFIPASMIAAPMRTAITADLERLKQLHERHHPRG